MSDVLWCGAVDTVVLVRPAGQETRCFSSIVLPQKQTKTINTNTHTNTQTNTHAASGLREAHHGMVSHLPHGGVNRAQPTNSEVPGAMDFDPETFGEASALIILVQMNLKRSFGGLVTRVQATPRTLPPLIVGCAREPRCWDFEAVGEHGRTMDTAHATHRARNPGRMRCPERRGASSHGQRGRASMGDQESCTCEITQEAQDRRRTVSVCSLFLLHSHRTLQLHAAQRMVDGKFSRRLDPDRARTQAAFRAVASCKRCSVQYSVCSVQCNTNLRNPGNRLSILPKTRSTPTWPGMQHGTRSPSWRRLQKC